MELAFPARSGTLEIIENSFISCLEIEIISFIYRQAEDVMVEAVEINGKRFVFLRFIILGFFFLRTFFFFCSLLLIAFLCEGRRNIISVDVTRYGELRIKLRYLIM